MAAPALARDHFESLLERLGVEKRLLFAVAARAAQGFVAGVEPDEVALRHASRRCERLVREGRVALLGGTSRDLPVFETDTFDKVYGVHVTDFWDDPQPHLHEIRRVLRPGGRLLLGSCAGEASLRLELALGAADFRRIRSEGANELAWASAEW